MYYPGEEKLVGLDVLKLYRGENVIRQDPEDIDLDQWLDKGELTELPEEPLGEAQRRSCELSVDRRDPDISPEPELVIQVIPEDPEEVPPEWNEVPDLMMEDQDLQPATEGAIKRKIDEVARRWRKMR